MMKKLMILFFVFIIGNSFAQTGAKIADTIRVVTLQKFKVPSDRNIVFQNILDISATANILDENNNLVRESTEIWQSPNKADFRKKVRGGRGVTVQLSFYDAIETPGNYFLDVKIKIKDENGRRHNIPAKYFIQVDYPSIAANIDLRDNAPYYFEEKKTFSFATIEFEDPNKYSYEIMDPTGEVLQASRGAIVVLDTVFKDLRNADKTLKVIGKYNGKTFSYISRGISEPKLSEWEIQLRVPEENVFGDWNRGTQDDPVIISVYNQSAKQILFTYGNSTTDGNFVFVLPQIRNMQLSSEPQGFIKYTGSTPSGVFNFVNIEYDEQMLQLIEDCGQLDGVILNIEFVTQFNKKFKKSFYATVIK